MKKIAVLLSIVMVLSSLTACGGNSSNSTEPPSNPPKTDDLDIAKTEIVVLPDDRDDSVGYYSDPVDHFARDPYTIYYIHNGNANMNRFIYSCLQNLAAHANINVVDATSNGDTSLYLGLFATAVNAGADGIICDMVYGYQERIIELCEEAGVPYMGSINTPKDEEGRCIAPANVMNQALNGQMQVDFLTAMYHNYWGDDVNPDDIGWIVLSNSSNGDLWARSAAAIDRVKELYPDNMLFTPDAVTITSGGGSAQIGYELVTPILATNPDVKYWLIASCNEDYSNGAARVCEEMGIGKEKILITACGASVLSEEWNKGYDGNWIANFMISNYQYSVPALYGLIAMIDGRATKETLWEDIRLDGDLYTRYVVGNRMAMREYPPDSFTNVPDYVIGYRDLLTYYQDLYNVPPYQLD